MNDLKRKIVVSTQTGLAKPTQIADACLPKQQEDDEILIDSMQNKNQSRPVIQQLRRSKSKNKTANRSNQRKLEQKYKLESKEIKPPKKLLMYHRRKEDLAVVDTDLHIFIKPTEKGLEFENNSVKMPYRFQK